MKQSKIWSESKRSHIRQQSGHYLEGESEGVLIRTDESLIGFNFKNIMRGSWSLCLHTVMFYHCSICLYRPITIGSFSGDSLLHNWPRSLIWNLAENTVLAEWLWEKNTVPAEKRSRIWGKLNRAIQCIHGRMRNEDWHQHPLVVVSDGAWE